MDANGKNSLREGLFDNLLEMDKMPISGMSMTYGSDSVVPDSANTGSSWVTGNKTFLAAINSFSDGTDCKWRFNGQTSRISHIMHIISRRQRFTTAGIRYSVRRYVFTSG